MYEKINHVLSNWDPIGLPDNVRREEYLGIIPSIIRIVRRNENIEGKIIELMNENFAIDLDATNQELMEDLRLIKVELVSIVNDSE